MHVLRIRRGERVTVLDGAGREFLCEVQDYDRDKVGLAVVETHIHPPAPCPVTLLQAVPKGKLIEAIIQKATELGAARIVPLLSERVVAQLGEGDAARKAAKMAVGRHGSDQAMRRLPGCREWKQPLTPNQFLARKESFELPLIASLQAGSRPAREYFRAFHAQHGRMPAIGLRLDRARGRFHPGGDGGDQGARRPAHHSRPARPAQSRPRPSTAFPFCNYELQSALPLRRSLAPVRGRCLHQHSKCPSQMLRMGQGLKLPGALAPSNPPNEPSSFPDPRCDCASGIAPESGMPPFSSRLTLPPPG